MHPHSTHSQPSRLPREIHGSASPPNENEAPEAQTSPTGVSARRLKKREIDRRCQRQARERTKSRIAYLEGLVESLKKSDSDNRSAALVKRIEDTERERDALALALRNVQKAVSALQPTNEKVEPDDDSPLLKDIKLVPANELENSSAFHYNSTSTACYRPTEAMSVMPMPLALSTHSLPLSPPMNQSTQLKQQQQQQQKPVQPITVPIPLFAPSSEGPIIPHSHANCDCCHEETGKPVDQIANDWRYLCTTMMNAMESANLCIPPEEDLLADDTPVRALLEGWDAVEQQISTSVTWPAIRKVDERVFQNCNPVTRLAVYIIMHQLSQYHIDPSPERYAKVPEWYRPRPSCQTQKHSYAINFLTWPGLRERFVYYQHNYCANIFWKLIGRCISVNWPYDFRDCFAQRWDTKTFVISPLFRECVNNIYNWQMSGEFFEHFPELRSDIPHVITSPRPVSNTQQMQLANWSPAQVDRVMKTPPQDLRQLQDTRQQQTIRQQHDLRQPIATSSSWDTQAVIYPFLFTDQATQMVVPGMASNWIL